MNLQNIGSALRRKLGPLPVWAWAIIGGVALYFLRAQGYFGGRVETGETLQPAQADAREPQTQVTLQPGESVYDPNTGGLTTAPGGEVDQVDVPEDNTDALLAAILKAVTKKKPKPRKAKHQKPKKKKPKPKPAHRQKPHKKRNVGRAGSKKHGDPKPRGATAWRIRPIGRAKRKPGGPRFTPAKPRTPQATSASGARQRPTTPMVVRSSDRQHPVSTHGRRNKKPTASPPRPSSPPKRNVHRTVRRKKHK